MKKLITSIAISAVIFGTFDNLKLIALESNSKQQVTWSADGNSNMRIIENSRILEMTTNVIVNQGSLEIKGDRAIFEYEASTNELKQVQVYGTPVLYQQNLDGDGSLVSGVSDSLIFSINDFEETILELIGNAKIESPSSTISCSSIIYVVERDLIRDAAGPCEGALGAQQN
tara:strand:+ start:526 stop:1041 length:516 start_codon:yes stop_codon:yes gene_type:complete